MSGNWIKLAEAVNIGEGEMIGVVYRGHDIAIYNVDGVFHATDNTCTHALALLSNGYLDGTTVECPHHAGRFDVRTGKALCSPVVRDLKTYAVKLEDGAVLVDVN